MIPHGNPGLVWVLRYAQGGRRELVIVERLAKQDDPLQYGLRLVDRLGRKPDRIQSMAGHPMITTQAAGATELAIFHIPGIPLHVQVQPIRHLWEAEDPSGQGQFSVTITEVGPEGRAGQFCLKADVLDADVESGTKMWAPEDRNRWMAWAGVADRLAVAQPVA